MTSQAEWADYRNSRPAKRMGAGALLRDAQDRVLVQPSYKPGWEVPGGVVEQIESPRAACSREPTEELGHMQSLGCSSWSGKGPSPSAPSR